MTRGSERGRLKKGALPHLCWSSRGGISSYQENAGLKTRPSGGGGKEEQRVRVDPGG